MGLLAPWLLVSVSLVLYALPAAAHPDDPHHEEDAQPPYTGPGYVEALGGSSPVEFPSSGIKLRSWLTLADIDPAATSGNDCWGYVSGSGREYALIGVRTGTGVVEVTDPANAQLVTFIPGPVSLWRDVKTYQHFGYAVSEAGGGIQVFDLSDIDSGSVVERPAVTTGGPISSHNVIINEDSGRLYRAGGGSTSGLRIYDLADPNAPAFLGEWNGRYCHDAQVVTWTEPPFVGVEVAFCYADDFSGGGNPGIEILDLSDPNAISTIGSLNLSLPPFSHLPSYSHQGWLSPDRRYLYSNDEIDEHDLGTPTSTRIIDVQDLTNPVQAAMFWNTTLARDHNLYTQGNFVYEANYRSGLRVLRASGPLSLSEIAFFDTYPTDDDPHYNGLWSVYPYFPSGTVIGSDIEKGLFVWTLNAAAVPTLPRWAFGLLALLLVLSLARGLYRRGRGRSSRESRRAPAGT